MGKLEIELIKKIIRLSKGIISSIESYIESKEVELG